MSDFIIRNGRGDGNRALVDSAGRLHVAARSAAIVGVSTAEGDQYLFPVGVRSIATVDTEYAMLYINPNSNSRRFHVQRLVVTVRDATPILFKLYRGGDAPTANNVSFGPGNTNTNSVKQASIDADVWNGVGTGMTVASLGTESFAGYFAQGATDIPIDGGQIWGLNAGIVVTAECSATNALTAVVTGWEEDADQ